MDNNDDNNKSLINSISAAVHSLVKELSGDVINPESEHSINADKLNEILSTTRMKLNGVEYNNKLQSKISECVALLKQISVVTLVERDDLDFIRDLLNYLLQAVGDSSETDELDDDIDKDIEDVNVDQIEAEDEGVDEHKECN